MTRDRDYTPAPNRRKSAVERLAEIRIEIEAAKLEKLRAETEAAKKAVEPSKYTPYEDYPPPSPEDRDRFIAKLESIFERIDAERDAKPK